jgi:hypothetical protein
MPLTKIEQIKSVAKFAYKSFVYRELVADEETIEKRIEACFKCDEYFDKQTEKCLSCKCKKPITQLAAYKHKVCPEKRW